MAAKDKGIRYWLFKTEPDVYSIDQLQKKNPVIGKVSETTRLAIRFETMQSRATRSLFITVMPKQMTVNQQLELSELLRYVKPDILTTRRLTPNPNTMTQRVERTIPPGTWLT